MSAPFKIAAAFAGLGVLLWATQGRTLEEQSDLRYSGMQTYSQLPQKGRGK